VARSVYSLKSCAIWFTFLVVILFLSPTPVKSAAEDAGKAASLRNLSVQLIDVAAEQLRRGAYSAAQRSLEQANENRQYLSASEQKRLDDLLAKTGGASIEREKTYEKMQAADAFAKSKNYSQAISTLSSIQDSPYLSKDERTEVQTRIKTYRSELKNQQEAIATLFVNSIKQYDEGKLEEARNGFQQVADSGVPLVSTGPSAREYIAKIDAQLGKGTATAKAVNPVAAKPTTIEEELLSEKSSAGVINVTGGEAPKAQEKQPAAALMPAAKASGAKEPEQCATVEGSYIDKVMQQRNVQRSYTEAVVDDAVAKARAQMAQGKFDTARDSISSARLVVDNNKILLGDEIYKRMSDTLNGLRNEIDAKAAASAALEQQQKQQQAAALQEQLRGQQEAERSARIEDLMSKALALQREQRYEDARGQLELLLAIDPLNEHALTMHQTLTDMINFRKQLEVRKEIDEQTNETFLNADKSNIPHADEVTYPRDWREITSKRVPEEIAGMSAADVQVNKQLDTIVDLSKLSPDTTFADAIAILQNSVQPQLKIVVLWKDLEDNADITRLTRINMEPVSGIPLRKALDLLLSSVSGGGFVQLGYVVENGVVTVATKASLPSNLVQREYGVGDLLSIPAEFITDLSTTGLGQVQQVATAGGTGGGGGGGTRTQQQGTQIQTLTPAELAAQAQLRIQEVVAMIQEIDPDTWYINGGRGTVRIWGKSLVVVQTAEVHQKIAKLIEGLRSAMGLGQQIAIEARFLLVTESFLEDIGFDVDWLMPLSGEWARGGPLTVTQDSITDTSITGGTTNNPVAMTITGGYGGVLDDLQVRFLIKATQESSNARQLQAPRVTVLSSESATLQVTTDQTYVSNVTAQQSTASAGTGQATNVATTLQNQISVVTSGVILNVTPTISSDKKYVILRITANVTNVLSLAPFTFTAAATGTSEIPATIFVPELQVTQVQTRISVPDKGTLLLGGQKITDESELEAGVPILGKLPVIGRLFNNRSEQRSQKVLLILVTPTILLQDEREAEAVANMQAPGL
jgi:type II secretory pathway component GspD/PulD (secretin)/tetratricopeptide (TPR) repeat protein